MVRCWFFAARTFWRTRGCRRAGVKSVASGCDFPSPPPDPGRSARADQAHTSTDVAKRNPEPKPTVVEPLVESLSWEIIL